MKGRRCFSPPETSQASPNSKNNMSADLNYDQAYNKYQ